MFIITYLVVVTQLGFICLELLVLYVILQGVNIFRFSLIGRTVILFRAASPDRGEPDLWSFADDSPG